MAANDNVTGYFGQEEINLQNAATEATLKQILEEMQRVNAAKPGSKFKSQEDLDKALRDLAKKAKEAAEAGGDFAKAFAKLDEETKKQIYQEADYYTERTKQLGIFIRRIDGAANAIIALTGRVGDAAEAFRAMDGSIGGAVGALGQIPLGIGQVIKNVFGPVASAVDSTFNSFVDAAAVGANFEGNMRNLITSSAKAGLSLQQFTSIIRQSGATLVALGGSTAEGAKKLAKFGEDIRNHSLGADLARLGYSTQAINEGFIDYAKIIARTGRLGQRELQQDGLLLEGTAKYLKTLDAISKLTGKNKEVLQAEQEQRMNFAAYAATLRKMDPKSAVELDNFIKTLPPTMQKAAMSMVARQAPIGEEAANLMVQMPEVANMLISASQQISQTGRLNEGFARTAYDLTARNVRGFADSSEAETFAKYFPEMNESMAEIFKFADLRGNASLAKIEAEREKLLQKIEEGIKNQTIPDLIDPATVQQFRQNIVQKSLEMQEALAEIDLKKLAKRFEDVANAAIKVLPKAIDLAAENFYAVAGAVATLKGATLLAALALKALTGAAIIASGRFLGKSLFYGLSGEDNPVGRAKVGAGLRNIFGGGTGTQAGPPVSNTRTQAKLPPVSNTGRQARGSMLRAGGGGILGGIGAGLRGLAGGLTAFANPAVLLGAGALGLSITAIGAGIAAATWLMGGALGKFSEGLKSIGEVDGSNLSQVAKGTLALSAAMVAMGAGSTVGAVTGFVGKIFGGGSENFAKKLNKTLDELDKNKIDMYAISLEKLGNAMTSLRSGMTATGSSPSSSTATNAQSQMNRDADEAKKAAEAAKLKEGEAKKKLISDTTGTGTKTKKSPEEVMLALNTNIEELVRLTGISNDLSKRHIGITSGLTNDAYSV